MLKVWILFIAETERCTKFNLTCEYTCDNSSEGFKCICKNGYELAFNGINCTGRYSCICVCDYTVSIVYMKLC